MATLDPAYERSGCPSGLSPPGAGPQDVASDPTAFVRAEADGQVSLELAVTGARCAGCIQKIESACLALSGVSAARLNLSTGKLRLSGQAGRFDPRVAVDRLRQLGYGARPFDPAAAGQADDAEGRGLLRRMAVAGFASANIMLLSVSVWSGADMGPATRDLFHWLSALIAAPTVVYAGQPFFRSAFTALRHGRANMDVPISLGVSLALGMSLVETARGAETAYFDAAVMLLFFLLTGRFLDHRLRNRARSAARDLLALQAVSASRVEPDGTVRAVASREIAAGDRLIIAPGERFVVDAEIERGRSEADLSLVTGETDPAPLAAGDSVRAGVVNLSAQLTVRVLRPAEQSLLAELTRLLEAGAQSRNRYVKLADKASALYVPLVHSAAALTFLGVWLLTPASPHEALLRAIALLIITCPCALGLAAPAVQVVATGRLFRKGVLVKAADGLERLAEADCAVLDKTGTLTLGRPRLVDPLDPADDTVQAAARLARASRHPIARAFVQAVGAGPVADEVVESPGEGLSAEIDSRIARLGRADFVGAEAPPEGAGSTLWFRWGEAAPVCWRFQDALKADAAAAVAGLKARGLSVELCSGDRSAPVQRAAEAAGIEHWAATRKPEDKLERLNALKAEGRRPLMVGDGLNDAAALAGAFVAIAPGAAADASQSSADFIVQGDRLSPILDAVDLARTAKRRMLENFALAAGYNLIAAPLAILGFASPLVAAIAMSASSLIVTLNAMRPSRAVAPS
ncbi:MAG: heavy metal translocating P-type ATPase [Maricaulaceae bacterium]